MRKIINYLENVYYTSFSSTGKPSEIGSSEKNTMFQSIFIVIMLRFILSFLFLGVVFYGIYNVNELKISYWIASAVFGYLFAPICSMLVPEKMMLVPLHKEKDFYKGAYLPIPLTLVWLLPKFLK